MEARMWMTSCPPRPIFRTSPFIILQARHYENVPYIVRCLVVCVTSSYCPTGCQPCLPNPHCVIQKPLQTLPQVHRRHGPFWLGTTVSDGGLLPPRILHLLQHPVPLDAFKWKPFYGFRISYKHLNVCGICGRTGSDQPAYLSSWDPPSSNSCKPELAFSACVTLESVKLFFFLAQMV